MHKKEHIFYVNYSILFYCEFTSPFFQNIITYYYTNNVDIIPDCVII